MALYDPIHDEQECKRCCVIKPSEDFCKDRRSASGLNPRCRECESEAKSERKRSDATREWGYQRNYGISLKKFNSMYVAQRGLCAVCGKSETATRNGVIRQLCVDHDHETHEVRGLLCSLCNITIGTAGDDPVRLEAMAAYLRKNGK